MAPPDSGGAHPTAQTFRSETVANTNTDQPWINLHRAQLAAVGCQHIAADLHFLHVKVDQPMAIQLEIHTCLQSTADAVILQTRTAVEQVDVGNARVVDTGTDIRQ